MKRTIILKDPPAPPSRAGAGWALRSGISLACALAADGLQWFFPPLWVVCDGMMVVALLAIWGARWEIAVAVLPEMIPGLDLFPTWTLFVGYLIATRRNQPRPGPAEVTKIGPGPRRDA